MTDAHDRRLQNAVAPAEWRNPEAKAPYHLVVIGGGTAGLVSAAGAAGLGARVALIEKHRMGGDCLNYGCVPSKALLAAARARQAAARLPEFGLPAETGAGVDFAAVMERLRRLRADLSGNDSVDRFQKLGVDVYLGEARFASDGRSIEVGERRLWFHRVALCMGARPMLPEIEGLKSVPVLTNETVFELRQLPQRLAVIGGGPIGCELAQAFAGLGSQVTILQKEPRLLPRDDADAAARLQAVMDRQGVRVLAGATIRSVRPEGAGARILVERDGAAFEVVSDAVLVAAGRTPNVEGMNLEAAGVRYDTSRGVHVDDRLRTANRRIYAAGDVCFPYKFTHAADFLARTLIQNALFFGRARASALTIPWCTYTSPEVAQIGLTEEQAARRGVPITTFLQELRDVDRAVLDGETEGFVKIHAHRGTDRIAGATIVASHAGELISQISVAMRNGVGLKAIASTIHPYPTQADAIRKIGDQYNRTRLTPFARWILKTRLRWMR